MSQALANIRLKTHDMLATPMLPAVIALGFDAAFRDIAEGPRGTDALAASANGRSFTTRHEQQVVHSTTVNRSHQET
jgi:hypothetical protein